MKTTLYTIITAIIILNVISCESNAKKQERISRAAFVEDSIQAEKDRKDRIEKERIDSLSLIAWGDSKFGMSRDEALQTSVFEGGRKWNGYYKWVKGVSPKETNNISGTSIGIYSLNAWFEVDELFSIDIKSREKNANYLNQIKRDVKIIEDGFTDKYGKPDYTKGDFGIFDFTNRDEITYARWEIGSKSVFIKLGEYDNSYYYLIRINNSKYPTMDDPEKIKYKEEQEKEKEEKRKLEF